VKEKQICWTGSQGEYDDPVSLSKFLNLVMFHFSARRQHSPGAIILAQSKSVLSPTKNNYPASPFIPDTVNVHPQTVN
jgi:hypothetical protein